MKLFTTFSLLLLISGTLICQNHLVLQPGPTEGKDAVITDYYPEQNFGDHISFLGIAWTYLGTPVVNRSLMQFDLSKVDPKRVIEAAYLDLNYSFEDFSNPPHTGGNGALLMPVISDWSESIVTWNTQPDVDFSKAIKLRQSDYEQESYNGIDVTELVRLGVSNLSNYHGWLFQLENEVFYANLKFASSDAASPYLRPRLTIVFNGKLTDVNDTNHTACILKQSDGNFIFDFNEKQFQSLSVFNIDGRNISTVSLRGLNNYELNLDNLNKGIYYAVLYSSEFKETFKISN